MKRHRPEVCRVEHDPDVCRRLGVCHPVQPAFVPEHLQERPRRVRARLAVALLIARARRRRSAR